MGWAETGQRWGCDLENAADYAICHASIYIYKPYGFWGRIARPGQAIYVWFEMKKSVEPTPQPTRVCAGVIFDYYLATYS